MPSNAVLSRRFRKLYLRYLEQAYTAGKLHFCGELQSLSDPESFARYLAPLQDSDWVVYAKAPFGLARCRELLAIPPPIPQPNPSYRERCQQLTGIDPFQCPKCHRGTMVRIAALPIVKLAAFSNTS
jgi:hypothetical protein